MSKPMAFWKEQDVLAYKIENNLPIASPYGDVVAAGQTEGQMMFAPCGKLICTKEQRTGCMFCPVGYHLDGPEKFKRLKEYNPKIHDYCMEELGEKELIEFVEKNYMKQ